MSEMNNKPMSISAAVGCGLTAVSAILFFFVPIAFITGLIGGVLSIIGLKDTKDNKKRGRELAMIGTILAGAFIIFALLVLYMMLMD